MRLALSTAHAERRDPAAQAARGNALARHLAGVIALKIVGLAALWWLFVHPHPAERSPAEVAAHLQAISHASPEASNDP